jgi:CDP-diacylglycerol--serine O-phosphatidyltransferase
MSDTGGISRKLRYMAPNAVTALSIVFAVLAVQSAIRGEVIWGAWWALYSTLTDKLDGFVARLLKASSPIGVQMDSLADLLNYGMAPAAITYAFFVREKSLGWGSGAPYYALCTICCIYALCAAFRLARFNVSESNPTFFFGIPSTMSGAATMALFITLGKYGDPAWTRGESYPGPRLLGDLDLSAVMPYYPIILLLFGISMVSGLRVPKIGKMRSKAANIYIVGYLLLGYLLGLMHMFSEFITLGAIQYLLLIPYYHFFASPKVRPEPLFPGGPAAGA